LGLWKPVAISVVLTAPLCDVAQARILQTSLSEPWSEVARTVAATLLILWSVGAFAPMGRPPVSDPQRLVSTWKTS
jgi:hypothetical protein